MEAPAVAKPVAAAGAVAVLGGFVAAVPPHGQAFYPACPLHTVTGLWCPVCGATRGVHALLTGHLHDALHDNVLLFAAAPIALYLWVSWLLAATGRRPLPALRWNTATTVITVVVFVAYGVLRNLPGHPFSGLAPLATVRQ